MEIDVKDEELNNNNNCESNNSSTSKIIIDSINNNVNGLLDKFSEGSAKIDADESSLPSPKAMLETIMPCEKLCSSFRQIADDISASDVIKTHIKHEISEPKLACEGEDLGREQFPLNLKSMRHGTEIKQGINHTWNWMRRLMNLGTKVTANVVKEN
ncbi:CLUMA_CG018666, isoform A [Clunio marinus]|uniref:CLUMA_CG018666, isoform A n=1 Tax=Clunio marinus TaxID=568069 RepID=A0A1J1J0H5_9DIPT|nr:CLUMA_CG018666, isoform A [Clunio marinus]